MAKTYTARHVRPQPYLPFSGATVVFEGALAFPKFGLLALQAATIC